MAEKADGLPQDENSLLRQAIEGDADAFGTLYSTHLDAIYRYIFFRVGDQAQAEDLTEEVFMKAWEALPRYRAGEHPFTSWLYRIAHNLVIDHHRKLRPETLTDVDLDGARDTGLPPEALLEARQDMAGLSWAIQQLEEEDQQVILLRFIEGLSHREIGLVIGKSEGASRVIQHRALSSLHALLTEDGRDA